MEKNPNRKIVPISSTNKNRKQTNKEKTDSVRKIQNLNIVAPPLSKNKPFEKWSPFGLLTYIENKVTNKIPILSKTFKN